MSRTQEKFEQALAFATEKHKGQYRIGGAPFISHPIEVCKLVQEKGYGLDYQLTALFHDLLEDTDTKEKEILEIGGADVLEAVKLLTKEPNYYMPSYIARIKGNPIAFAVKTADRLHNLRCAKITSEKFKRKYIKETQEWYMDFSEDICVALEELIQSI